MSMFNRISYQDKLLFTKHLDTMIKAGIPISEALDTLVDQAKSKEFKKVIKSISKSVENGQSLAKSLGHFPKIYDDFYISLIEVGEESGTLEENLGFLAKQMSKDFRLRKKIQGALIYPALVLTTTAVMGGFISFFILPKLVDFFAAFDVELPLTTKVLLWFANTMKNYGIAIFIVLIIATIIFRFLIKLPSVKPVWHTILLRIPLVGRIIVQGQLSRFARNLGTLIRSGVPVSRAMEITSDTMTNLKFKNDLVKITRSLTKGKNIGTTLEKYDFFEYPPLVSKMIAIGEKTGKLDETLLYLGDFYEDEVDELSKNLSTILEPILLIGIGIVVGFVALAIISPIYELTGSIRVGR